MGAGWHKLVLISEMVPIKLLEVRFEEGRWDSVSYYRYLEWYQQYFVDMWISFEDGRWIA